MLFDAANIHFSFSTMQYIVLNKLQFIDFQYTFSQKTFSKRDLWCKMCKTAKGHKNIFKGMLKIVKFALSALIQVFKSKRKVDYTRKSINENIAPANLGLTIHKSTGY